jgi:hypothetical protein
MPINRAQFDIEITGKDAGAKAIIKDTAEELKTVGKSAKEAGEEGEEGAQKLKKGLKESGEAAHEAGLSHHEVHQGLHLLSTAAGDALGPIGELTRMLGNPYIMAAAGATLAIKMLIEQHEKLIETTKENITKSEELHDIFDNAVRNATVNASNAITEFHQRLSEAGTELDRIGQKLINHIALTNAAATAAREVATAELALAQARIQAAELSGQITEPQGDLERRRAEEVSRSHQHEIEKAARDEETESKRHAANTYDASSVEATRKADAAASEKIRLDALNEAMPGLLKTAHEDLASFQGQANEARAKAEASGPRPSAELLDQAHNHMALAFAQPIVDREAKYAEAERLQKMVEGQKGVVANQEAKAAQYKREAEDADRLVKRLEAEAISHKNIAEALRAEVQQREALANIQDRAFQTSESDRHETSIIQRRNTLQEHINRGQATPDEQAEWQGANARGGEGSVAAEARRKIDEITRNVRMEGGHASAQEVAELKQLNDMLVGALENVYGTTTRTDGIVQALMSRVSNLESTYQTNR